MTRTLSKPQLHALTVLAAGKNRYASAYDLGVTLSTLNALERRGLVTANRSGLGALFSSRIGIMFRMTDAGFAALKER